MEVSYKFRLYPNHQQEELIQRTFGCCRFVYNYYLAMRKRIWEANKGTLNYIACASDLTQLKQTFDHLWLKEVDATALQSSLRDLDVAFQNFFRTVNQTKGIKSGYPRFKRKTDHRKSYKSKRVGENIKIVGDRIQLPKLGLVKCRISKQVQGRILSATVSQNLAGQYYVSLCCTDIVLQTYPPTGSEIGIDLGVKDLLVGSDGTRYENNKYLRESEAKLAKLQRSLSRKKKGSARWEKQRIRVARLQEHIANQRKDTLHKATTELIRNHEVICIEDLNVKGMVKNHNLAKSISDASFGELRRQLEYKAAWYGRKIVAIDRFFPSSQLCNCCGNKNSATKDLSVREWTCPNCGVQLDRDLNAAINIKKEGLRIAVKATA